MDAVEADKTDEEEDEFEVEANEAFQNVVEKKSVEVEDDEFEDAFQSCYTNEGAKLNSSEEKMVKNGEFKSCLTGTKRALVSNSPISTAKQSDCCERQPSERLFPYFFAHKNTISDEYTGNFIFKNLLINLFVIK